MTVRLQTAEGNIKEYQTVYGVGAAIGGEVSGYNKCAIYIVERRRSFKMIWAYLAGLQPLFSYYGYIRAYWHD